MGSVNYLANVLEMMSVFLLFFSKGLVKMWEPIVAQNNL
jgi:hypothetical protein